MLDPDSHPDPEPTCFKVPVPLRQKVSVPAFPGSGSTTLGSRSGVTGEVRSGSGINHFVSTPLKVLTAKKWPTVFGPTHET